MLDVMWNTGGLVFGVSYNAGSHCANVELQNWKKKMIKNEHNFLR